MLRSRSAESGCKKLVILTGFRAVRRSVGEMVLEVEATEYLGRAITGRSRPMRCVCECAAGDLHEVYVKYAGFHEEFAKNHLVGEMVANKLALDLQLPAAEPCLVRVEEAFLETLPDDQDGDALRMALQPTPLVAFGSRQIAPARRWEPSDLVHKSQAREAVMLYLFDTLVENSDRGNGNPNLLMSGLSFKIIDFGHSFQRCHDADAYCNGAKPWQVGGIGNHYQGNLQHIMFPRCRGLEEAVLHEFKASLLELSDDRIAAYVDVVPDDWGQDTTCRIIDYLIEAREHAEDFVNQVRGVLT